MWLDRKTIKEIDEEAGIDTDLIGFVDRATTDRILHDDGFKVWENPDIDEQEARHLTELAEVAEHMTRTDLAVVIGVALVKHPLLVFQVIAEFVINLIKQRRVSND